MQRSFACPQCRQQLPPSPKLTRWLETGEVLGVDGLFLRCPAGHTMPAQATTTIPMTRRDLDAGKADCPGCGTVISEKTFDAFWSKDGTPIVDGAVFGRCRSCNRSVVVKVRAGAN